MRYAIRWIRSNPVTVVAAAVVVLALGFLGWIQVQGAGLEERVAAREDQIRKIKSFMQVTVEVPDKDPDAPPQVLENLTANLVEIDKLKSIHERMNSEHNKIFKFAVAKNQGDHLLLAEGIFPAATDPARPIEARDAYRHAFERMLQPDADDAVLPRLNAGMPPMLEDLNDAILRVEDEFKGFGEETLSEAEDRKLFEEQSQRLIELLEQRARELDLYAETDPYAADFPFHVGAWSNPTGRPPQPHQLWEGQLELWIQQDLARVIALTNRKEDSQEDGVIGSPVKRLIKIEVVPGYVGLHTRGGLVEGSADRALRVEDETYPPPQGGQRTNDPDQAQSNNFFVGPTGRVSNAIYDVRHARLTAVVDLQRLPKLLNNIGKVNFMTVLGIQWVDVDEYEALQEGFVYGSAVDAAEVTMVVETIWLREWTEQYMPEKVRQYVGIDEPDLRDTMRPGGQPGGPAGLLGMPGAPGGRPGAFGGGP